MNRSRLQSQDAPSRFSCWTIAPPDFGLPPPDPLEKRLAAHRAPVGLLRLGELALDHHLGRDAGVVGARLPEHVAAVHPPVAAQNVLQGVVERVAHVQVAGDVRRRNDDAEGLGAGALGPSGPEGPGVFPQGGNAGLDRGSVKRFVHHRVPVRAAPGRGG